jgi:hypothetical protein
MRLVMSLVDGPKSREEIVELFQRYSYDDKYWRRRQSETRREKHNPLPSNISKVAMELHRWNFIRIFYTHPKLFTPVTRAGKLKPRSRVFYMLRRHVQRTFKDWMIKSLQEPKGVLGDDKDVTMDVTMAGGVEYFEQQVELKEVTGKCSITGKDIHADDTETYYQFVRPSGQIVRIYKKRVPDELRLRPIHPSIKILTT